jgi:hypothetical protein
MALPYKGSQHLASPCASAEFPTGVKEVLAMCAPWKGLRGAAHGYGLLAKEELKSFLLKMMVVTEGLSEGIPPHDVHGDTVCQAMVFVWSLFIGRETFQERFMGLRDHRDVWVGANMARQIDGALPRMWT